MRRYHSYRFLFGSIAALAAFFCSLAIAPDSAWGQTPGSFDSGSDGSDGSLFIPGTLPPIDEFAAVYDQARGEVFVFGGSYFTGGEIDHTYAFDGSNWSRKRPENSPPVSDRGTMAYDASLDKTILYNFDFSLGNNDNFCWLWDGTDWEEIDPPDPEISFEHAALVYDAEQQETLMVVKRFFGNNSEFVETWSFDGTSWTEKTPITVPPAGSWISLCYDASLEKVVMILRENASIFHTWTWDGANWSEIQTDEVDIDPIEGHLLYDGRTNSTIYLGDERAFTFSGSNWIALENVPEPFNNVIDSRKNQIVYDPGLNAILRLNGYFSVGGGANLQRNETWAWHADGSVEMLSKGSFQFDMSGKPNGIWNYTTIDVGPNTIVEFLPNQDNTPARWLASGDVVIEGILDLSASRREEESLDPLTRSLGGYPGPGGYKGATGGPEGVNLRIFGDGPGGGLYTGASKSNDGDFDDYGNPWLYPLTGGSGAGNLNASFGGGGGGGAIEISSSGEVILFGSILTNGSSQNNSVSGTGSRGAVLLRSNSLKTPDGTIAADHIKLEAWDRETDDLNVEMENPFQNLNEGLPLLPVVTDAPVPKIWIESVNGIPISNPTTASESPDEVDADFTTTDPVSIIVKGENIPLGAEIHLQISLEDGTTLEPDPVTFSGSQAIFNLELSDGYGAISATARFLADITP